MFSIIMQFGNLLHCITDIDLDEIKKLWVSAFEHEDSVCVEIDKHRTKFANNVMFVEDFFTKDLKSKHWNDIVLVKHTYTFLKKHNQILLTQIILLTIIYKNQHIIGFRFINIFMIILGIYSNKYMKKLIRQMIWVLIL